MTNRILRQPLFLPISYPAWRDSLAMVHRFVQVIGKIRLAPGVTGGRPGAG